MKNLLSTFLLIMLVSCSKEKITPDSDTPTANVISSSAISYKSENININSFKAQAADKTITVGFLTLFQKDVKTLEILRGVSSNNLCSIYKTDVAGNTTTTLQYSTEDEDAEHATLYYIIKYTLQNNDWGYTPMFTLHR